MPCIVDMARAKPRCFDMQVAAEVFQPRWKLLLQYCTFEMHLSQTYLEATVAQRMHSLGHVPAHNTYTIVASWNDGTCPMECMTLPVAASQGYRCMRFS